MTEEQMKKFKESVFTPYTEAWNMIKAMRDTKEKNDDFWEKYLSDALSFPEKFDNSEIARSLVRVIIDAGDEYARIERAK